MITIGTVTEQNKQPEPPTRKPNEDYVVSSIYSETAAVAVVMDGIPVLRDANGNYPQNDENGSLAAELAGTCIKALLHECSYFRKWRMAEAFAIANQNVAVANKGFGKRPSLYTKRPSHWVATVGCALWLDTARRKAIFGSIGDPIAFFLPDSKQPELLGRDQLAPSIIHREKAGHLVLKNAGDGYSGGMREWQDQHIRNKIDARCFCGKVIPGWGALTGEPEATKFVKIRTISLPKSGRFILASDAVCIFGGEEKRKRTIQHYLTPLSLVRKLKPAAAAQELLVLTRLVEQAAKARSDDATFAVVDFEC